MSAAPRSRRVLAALLLAGLAACGLYLFAEGHLLAGDFGFPLDDSWIHLQFARNLARGEGLVYNPGEPVTGSTAPLWTALVSLLFLLPGNIILWVKALGTALYLAGVHASWTLARELDLSRGLAALAAALTLATGPLVWSALSGMEVPLFTLLSLWGMILHLRERRVPERGRPLPLSLPVLALAVLARPEGLLLLVAAAADRVLLLRRGDDGGLRLGRPDWRALALGLAFAVVVLAGPLVFYAAAGGSPLPTTYSAKSAGLRRLLPEPRYVSFVLGIFFRSQPWMTLAAGAGVLALVERLGGRRDRGLLPALWPLGLPLAYSLISPLGPGILIGNFGRYYFPLFPLLVVLGVAGLERPAALLAGRRWWAAALLALLAWPTASGLFTGAAAYAGNVANVQDSDVKMARFLAPRLAPEAVLAVNDIGAFKYLLPNRVIDLVGIVSPDARRQAERRVAEGVPFYDAMAEILEAERPDYVVVFPTWLPGIERDERFTPLVSLVIPDNRTMGGDEIVLYATPWTRYPLREPAGAGDVPGDPTPPGRGSQEER